MDCFGWIYLTNVYFITVYISRICSNWIFQIFESNLLKCSLLLEFPSFFIFTLLTSYRPIRSSGQWLHQRELHRWLQEAERLHRHPGAAAGDADRLLEDGVGAENLHHRYDDQAGGEITGEPPPWERTDTLMIEQYQLKAQGQRALNNYINTYRISAFQLSVQFGLESPPQEVMMWKFLICGCYQRFKEEKI